jgi:RND family efflux transporter MFP subunit
MVIFRSLTFYLAIAGIVLAVIFMKKMTTPGPDPVHLQPAINPYEKTVAAAGIIEAIDKNIEIGIPHSAIVKEVYVKVGDPVKQGQILFRLDDRELIAQLLVQRANSSVAKENLTRLKDQLTRLESVKDPRAVSVEEVNTRRCDVAVATAQLEASEAQVTQTILLLERLQICAPQNGVILQNNIRKGEFIMVGNLSAMILGDIEHLQVRADIDEQNASKIIPQASATAFPKNNSSLEIPLHFERIEPYVIPKHSLTGAGDERVDTRVLQVIYSFNKPSDFPLYVGQQVDIFIEQPKIELIAQEQESPANAT